MSRIALTTLLIILCYINTNTIIEGKSYPKCAAIDQVVKKYILKINIQKVSQSKYIKMVLVFECSGLLW